MPAPVPPGTRIMPTVTPPQPTKIQLALECLTSAFPLTKFKIVGEEIVGGGVTVTKGLITGTPLAMVRVVGAQLKAIEDKAAEDARKKAAEQPAPEDGNAGQ